MSIQRVFTRRVFKVFTRPKEYFQLQTNKGLSFIKCFKQRASLSVVSANHIHVYTQGGDTCRILLCKRNEIKVNDTFLRSSTACAENFEHIEFEDFDFKYLYLNVDSK